MEEQKYITGGFETIIDRTENQVNPQDVGGVELMACLALITTDGMRVAYEEAMAVPFTGEVALALHGGARLGGPTTGWRNGD
jgi:hypothetical protein